MVVVPPPVPVTIPLLFTVATPVTLLAHVPPLVALVSVVEFPWHTIIVPVIGVSRFTVSVIVLEQPAPVVYVIVVVPMATPAAMPVPLLIVAVEVLLLVHVPPLMALLSLVVPPTHTIVVPVIGATGFTVTVAYAAHPAGAV